MRIAEGIGGLAAFLAGSLAGVPVLVIAGAVMLCELAFHGLGEA